MAVEREKQEEKEIKIPVFSVLKKGTAPKNIILNGPPHEPIPSIKCHENGDVSKREEEPVIFGRHLDCRMMLDYPSISSFHLDARAIPLLQKLSVTDRSLVRRTWVSGTKIPPNVPIELVEGDTLSLGAFEMENPLSPLLQEKEETHQEDKPGHMITDLNELWVTEIPSAPPMPDYMNPSPSDVPFSLPVEGEEETPERRGSLEENSSSFSSVAPLQESVGSSLPREEEIGYPKRWHPSLARSEKQASSLLSRRSKSKTVSFLRIHTGRSRENISKVSFDAEVQGEGRRAGENLGGKGEEKENGALSKRGKHEETICRALPENLGGKGEEKEEEETFGSDTENMTPKGSISRKMKSRRPDLWRSSAIVANSDMENWTPEVLRDLKLNEPTYENVVKSKRDDEMFCSDKENLTPGISSGWKINEKNYKMLQRSSFNTITASHVAEGVFDSDKENMTPKILQEMKPKESNVGGHMKIEDEEDEAFASDKENLTPQVSFSLKAKQISSKSSARIQREMIRKGVERITFQPLFENPSSRKSRFFNDAQMIHSDGNCNSVNHTQGVGDEMNCCSIQSMDKEREEKIWNIMVDTSCFPDDE